MSDESGANIRVICRIRPINQKEIDLGNSCCIEFEDEYNMGLRIANGTKDAEPGLQKFAFDRVFNMESTQEEVFKYGARPVIDSVLEGFNGTIFAYGQTSAGKTHTMQGKLDDENLRGIIPRMVTAVFESIQNKPEDVEFTVNISIVEIYLENIRDLLDPKKDNLKIRDSKVRGIYIEDVTEKSVKTEEEVYDIMRFGNTNRAVTATNMNEGSSRSHLVFILTLSQKNIKTKSIKSGKLCLIDLAGSEKVGKTGASGQTLKEAQEINKSLSALGNVINALTEGKEGKGAHIPYRDSKLTRLLQESLGGNSKTTLIIACSPSSFNDQETLSTLRFGYRAKSIKNKAKVNKEYTVAELQVMLKDSKKEAEDKDAMIEALKALLLQNQIEVPQKTVEIMAAVQEKQVTTSNQVAQVVKNAETVEVKKVEVETTETKNEQPPSPKEAMPEGYSLVKIKELEDELNKHKNHAIKESQKALKMKLFQEMLAKRVKDLEADLEEEINKQKTQAIQESEKIQEMKLFHEMLSKKVNSLETENKSLLVRMESMVTETCQTEESDGEQQKLDMVFNNMSTDDNDEVEDLGVEWGKPLRKPSRFASMKVDSKNQVDSRNQIEQEQQKLDTSDSTMSSVEQPSEWGKPLRKVSFDCKFEGQAKIAVVKAEGKDIARDLQAKMEQEMKDKYDSLFGEYEKKLQEEEERRWTYKPKNKVIA